MIKRIIFLRFLTCTILLFCTYVSLAQDRLRVGFYNLENFFDPFVDSTRVYNEFTKDGTQHWNYTRYTKKKNNIFKTIHAIGEKESISILGVCEIENDYVLKDLLYNTPLKKTMYQFVHYDSPDRRGIDIAIIYRKDQMRLINSRIIPLIDPQDSTFVSRDIVYASFEIVCDTIHVFVNHWPSRYGGELESQYRRRLAANLLRSHVDSLCALQTKTPKIIIMGDFNDTPQDESLTTYLRAFEKIDSQDNTCNLVNLFSNAQKVGFKGSLKFQHQWQIFDQIIISTSLCNDSAGVVYEENSAKIFTAPFLFEEDDRHLGEKLFRTYVGPKYFGGFSDHLPVFIDLQTNCAED
ncbi:MAG: endonuclease [Lentimicrobiaceae bacterium]|jgi:endonuclease/exonuclease/phosphatase family metal-dependent hydrolase|nr:endonuclease [Lentimicrobiaceae bacterium]